ncbi:DUF2946 family protein [Chitinibacter sp. ZOR0017]|uniref:DUF2946 family protein n=1 Tax=Chitinibacter sp. ZOR0017 TaxID=1339254 RepID=UPI00064723CD|nr:DUF2946 family protein [Chitinibacter sp. ZOR0017]
MSLRRFRSSSVACLAFLAMVMQLLLPFAHAAQMESRDAAFRDLVICRTAPVDSSGNAPAAPFKMGVMQCPVCLAGAFHLLAPPPAPSVLPPVQEHSSWFRLLEQHGAFIPTPSYTLPLSHAPPIDLV